MVTKNQKSQKIPTQSLHLEPSHFFGETTGHRDATHPGPGDIRWMTSQRQLGYGSSQRERERSRSRKGLGVEVGEGFFFPRTNLFLANLDGSVFVLKKKVA